MVVSKLIQVLLGLVGAFFVCFSLTRNKNQEHVERVHVFMMKTHLQPFFFKEEGKYFGCCWLCT